MVSWKPFIELKTSGGRPVQRGDVTLTPQAQALTVRFPFGGFVWNRPSAIIVERDGRRERIAIIDSTRVAILAMTGIATAVMLSTILAVVLGQGRKNN